MDCVPRGPALSTTTLDQIRRRLDAIGYGPDQQAILRELGYPNQIILQSTD